MRRFCQLVFLRHLLAAWRVVFPYSLRSSVRLVSLLVASSRRASRGYSLRFACRLILLINSFGGPLSRLVRRSGFPSCSSFLSVSLCPAHRFPSRPLVSSARLVKQFVFSRFARRLVSRLVVSSRVLRFVLFCSHLICPLRLVVVMTAAARHSHIMAACSRPPLPPVVESDLGMAAAE